VVWNSALGEEGDCVVMGATNVSQLEETLMEIERGPLEGLAVKRLDEMWKGIEADAPGNNYSTYKKLREARAF